ncbi:STE/STE11/cdc15 protein kinase [Mycena maculata]|uniref:STE/STE11/cdc15 protein kinase n=1 Tax=Mycena maculata TaxID=230809 RepID=A0AAD7NLA1_9AGAR|nr:STE/STE11/cdc15 protein kinase [Mycena maculata]
MATAVLASVSVPTSTSSHFPRDMSHRPPAPPKSTAKTSTPATPGASSSRPQPTLSVSVSPAKPPPKTLDRIRSSLEQSLRTATRSKKSTSRSGGDFVTLSSSSAAGGKGKERASNTSEDKEKTKASSVWGFRRNGRASVTPSSSPIPPSPSPAIHLGHDDDDDDDEGFHGHGYIPPTLRLGSLSSPALHLYSQALPSPKSQPAIPASSSSTSDALVSPSRTRRPSLQPLSDMPPITTRERPGGRMGRHRATQSNPLNSLTQAPTAPTRVTSSPQTPRRPTREPPPTPPDTPTPASGSRGNIARAGSSASVAPLPLQSTPIGASRIGSTSRNLSPSPTPSPSGGIRPRRVLTPLRTASASASHLPLSSSPPPTPTHAPRRPSVDRPSLDSPRRPSIDSPRRASIDRRESIDNPRRPSIDSPRRVSIDSPRRPSLRDESPSPSPVRPRTNTPSTTRPAYSTRQANASTTSLSGPTQYATRHANASTSSLLTPSHSPSPYGQGSFAQQQSNPEHRDVIRTATSLLCREVRKPPAHMSRSEGGMRDWGEVEVRVRALVRLERIWGRSGSGASVSNVTLTLNSPNTPTMPVGVNVGGEERERRLFAEALRDGFVLCQLMNKLRASSIVRPSPSTTSPAVCEANITKFLAACASYGLPSEDLFDKDDLREGEAGWSGEGLARVARTVVALVRYVEDPPREKVVSGGSNAVSGHIQKSASVSIYGKGQSGAASTPNLGRSVSSPSPTAGIGRTATKEKRWSPPADLPTVRSNSPGESSGTSSATVEENIQHRRDRERARANVSNTIDRGETSAGEQWDWDRDKGGEIPQPPPRSPLRPQSPKVDDETNGNGLFSWAMSHVQGYTPPRSVAEAQTNVSPGTGINNPSVDPNVHSRHSVLSTASGLTETTTTTAPSLLDLSRYSNRFGTVRTMATSTDATSEAPSITRTEGNSIAEDLAGMRKRVDSKMGMYGGGSFIDLSRVEEMDEAGTASRGLGRQWGAQQQPTPDVQRLDNKPDSNKPAIRLGKGKWPDDFMDALQPPPKSASPEMRESSPSPSPSTLSTSGPRKLAIVGAGKRNESVESLPQFPRRPTHRARHSVDSPVLLPKETRDTSPDGLPSGSRVIPRRNSTKPGPHRANSLAPRSDSRDRSSGSGSDALVPFPRTASGEHSPAGSSPPERATSPLSDKPRPPRGRFQSDVEGSSRRRPRPSSYDELGARPSRSRFESMMNLGVASGNTSASDLLSRDSLDGSLVRQALIIREEGKPPTHFQLGNCIGRGQFGSVYRALNLNTGQMVAVKRIRLDGLKEDEVTTLMREVDLVKSLSHPSIVKYEGMARDQDTLSIVLEYAENGSLGQTLKAFGKLNERLVASYVVKILEGLHYLHSSDVVHCDLKAANILTTKNGNVKLSDFGVSLNLRAMEREIKDVAGTPNWMAPEVIELKGASPKSDIWSLACTVVELLTGRPPYAEIANSMSVMFRIVEDDMPPLPEGCSPLLEDFLTQCFDKDPTKRPSADLLCEHQWLKKNWGAHKELRPQDSIPFLRRVSADLQKSEAVRFLSQIEITDSPVEADDQVSGSPPGRRVSLSTRPMDQDIPARDHSFVKTTFSKPMVCRVCLLNVKKSAVLCEQCSLIAHSRCAVNAPPTCDLRAQLLLYAQYAEKGNPGSAYSNPLDVLNEPHPMSPASEVAYVSHTPRTSLDGTPPALGLNQPVTAPTAFKFMAAFKRSRSNLSPEPDHASSSGSVPQVPPKDINQKKLRKEPRERPQSVKSTSTGANTSSLRSGESAVSRANPKSLDESRTTAAMQRKRSRLNSKSAPSEVTDLDAGSVSVPGGLPPESRHKKRSESRSGNCIVQ